MATVRQAVYELKSCLQCTTRPCCLWNEEGIRECQPTAGWELHGEQLCFERHIYIPIHEWATAPPNHLQSPQSPCHWPLQTDKDQGSSKPHVLLERSLKQYVKSCTTCTRSKATWHKPYRLLKQLLILTKPWDSISMDFIEQLPASSNHTSILVIMDCLTKQALFIPTHDTITSPKLAQLFLSHIFSKHGHLPMSPLTVALNSYPISSILLACYYRWNSTSHQDTTPKEMDKLNG